MTTVNPLVQVEDLRVAFDTARGRVEAVRGVSFTLGGREKLAIVGESGSGKSMTGRALLRLIPTGQVTAKTLRFDGQDLVRLPPRAMQAIRGRRISMIMQDPKFSLNPVQRVGKQIAEAYRVHHAATPEEARERALDMLARVQIRNPARVFDLYPHECSGGMGQRVMIAMMLIPGPDLLIADEPTSALDKTVQLEVLRLIDELVSERGMALLFISHDLNLVASFCDRVLILYGGQVMESCAAKDLHHASHPYTRGLLDALPSIDRPRPILPVLKRDPAWLQPNSTGSV